MFLDKLKTASKISTRYKKEHLSFTDCSSQIHLYFYSYIRIGKCFRQYLSNKSGYSKLVLTFSVESTTLSNNKHYG